MNMNESNHSANEALAHAALAEQPLFTGFSPMDFQRLLGLMQDPVRAIDTCMGKEQLRKVAKQLLAQHLALQTQVRNMQIEMRTQAQMFNEGMDQLEKAVTKHTDFTSLNELMMKEAEQQDADAAQQKLDLDTNSVEKVYAENGLATSPDFLADKPPVNVNVG